MAGEIYLERSERTSVAVHGGAVESLVQRRALGAGVRTFEDGRTAFASTSDLAPDGLRRAIETARAIARHTRQDEANRLPEMRHATGRAPLDGLINSDASLPGSPVAARIEIARRAEAAALAEDPRIRKVRSSAYDDAHAVVTLASSRDESIVHESTRCFVSVELVAGEEDRSQTGSDSGWALGPSGLDPVRIGRSAAQRAVRKLGARPATTARATVVLDPEATAGLLYALAGLFSAEAVLRGRSVFAGRTGRRIAGPCVTLVDDGAVAGGCESAPVDGEGTPTGETVLVRDGALEGFFHTVFTARKMGAPPTGNAVRGGYSGAPEASPTNLYLRPTGIGRDELLARAGRGLYVTEWMGLHNVNVQTGDVSIGASGLEISGSALGAPVDRATIAGNVTDLLGSVEAVATDLAFLVHGPGSTVLLREIRIGGSGA